VDTGDDPDGKKGELVEGFKKLFDVYIAAGNDLIDDVIDPRETRLTICRGLELAEGKKIERPWKRQGVVPV
jgi:acetyl-CoA carboxylase carboxyltransferase component